MKILIWIRSLIVTFVLFPFETVFLSFFLIFIAAVLKSFRGANFINQLWGRLTCWLFGVTVVVEGRENIPAGGAIFLFNHTSFFDIFTLYSQFPFVRYGAKVELFKIPVFGWAMKSVGTLPIARSNREAAIRVLQEAVERGRRGEKFALSPEGGRNTSEDLLPFKAGPFMLAIQAGLPLVPVVIQGALRVWPKHALVPATRSWSSVIRVQVLPTLPTAGLTVEDRGDLQAKVRKAMEAALRA